MRTSSRINGARKGTVINGVALLQGWFLIFILLLVVSIILAALTMIADWEASGGLLKVITHICVLAGAIWAGRKCSQKAWLNGLLVGVGAFLILTWLGEDISLLWTAVWFKRMFTIGLVGMLGGILGGYK